MEKEEVVITRENMKSLFMRVTWRKLLDNL